MGALQYFFHKKTQNVTVNIDQQKHTLPTLKIHKKPYLYHKQKT